MGRPVLPPEADTVIVSGVEWGVLVAPVRISTSVTTGDPAALKVPLKVEPLTVIVVPSEDVAVMVDPAVWPMMVAL
jgi:hypothetical protein